jgi:putative ABC transport system permease protein
MTMMLRMTLSRLRAQSRRMLATGFAVVLGVGFVSGTLIFSDTAKAGYFDTYSRTAKNIDVAVEPPAPSGAKGESVPLLSAAQAEAVRRVPGVAAVDARMVTSLAMLDRRGQLLNNFGQVGVAVSTDGDVSLRAFDVTGRVPSAPGEAMVDPETAAHQHLVIGDQITVVDRAATQHRYTLVGLIDFGTSKRFSGQSVVGLPAADIGALTGVGGYDEIVARGTGAQSALASEVRAALGAGPRVVTGDQRRIDLANAATSTATQLEIALVIFGVIALIVATFVIYNTFAILLAQRIRETALLRCVGAARRQIFASVLLESVVIGLVGAVGGIVCGVGVAYGLLWLLNGVLHAGVPVHAVVLRGTPILAGLLIGLVVTVGSAFVPAVRATRTAPLAALREPATGRPATRRGVAVRLVLTALVAAAGAGLTVLGTRNPDVQTGTFVIVAGGIVVFLAVLIAAPLFIGPLTAAVGALPARMFGPPARLASANARRNPGRTAATTATLMIGIGLMSLFSLMIASIKATAHAQMAGHYPVDYVMEGARYSDGAIAGIPAGYAERLRRMPQFSRVGEVRVARMSLNGVEVHVAAIDPGSLGSLIKPQLTAGRLADLRHGTAIMVGGRRGAPTEGIGVGGTVTFGGGSRSATFRSVGSTAAAIPGADRVDALVTWDDLAAVAGTTDDTTVMAKAAPGVRATASRDALDGLTGQYPLVQINSIADLSSDLDSTVNGMIALFGGLLGTAILIALFGIANTLSLSVVERTRESATVRALGLTRGQLRATLLFEALLMGVVGALVGIGYGLGYGRLVVGKAFTDIHPVIEVPWSWLAGLVVLAGAAAALAAVLPARRAARASIVAAMADI